jgi:hypothetical protein
MKLLRIVAFALLVPLLTRRATAAGRSNVLFILCDDIRWNAITLKDELSRLMKQSGLDPANDKMPVDAGIGKKLPDQKIR